MMKSILLISFFFILVLAGGCINKKPIQIDGLWYSLDDNKEIHSILKIYNDTLYSNTLNGFSEYFIYEIKNNKQILRLIQREGFPISHSKKIEKKIDYFIDSFSVYNNNFPITYYRSKENNLADLYANQNLKIDLVEAKETDHITFKSENYIDLFIGWNQDEIALATKEKKIKIGDLSNQLKLHLLNHKSWHSYPPVRLFIDKDIPIHYTLKLFEIFRQNKIHQIYFAVKSPSIEANRLFVIKIHIPFQKINIIEIK